MKRQSPKTERLAPLIELASLTIERHLPWETISRLQSNALRFQVEIFSPVAKFGTLASGASDRTRVEAMGNGNRRRIERSSVPLRRMEKQRVLADRMH